MSFPNSWQTPWGSQAASEDGLRQQVVASNSRSFDRLKGIHVDNGDPIESTAIKVLQVHDLIDVMQGKNAYIYIYTYAYYDIIYNYVYILY